MSTNLDDAQNEEFIAKKAIPANNNSSNFDQQRANINNQLAISHNSIYRFTKKIALKINVSFIDDKIYNLEKNNSFFNTQSINYNDIFW